MEKCRCITSILNIANLTSSLESQGSIGIELGDLKLKREFTAGKTLSESIHFNAKLLKESLEDFDKECDPSKYREKYSYISSDFEILDKEKVRLNNIINSTGKDFSSAREVGERIGGIIGDLHLKIPIIPCEK